MSEVFDYKDFAKNMVEQAKELLPPDLSQEENDYLLKTMENFITLSGEALINDESINLEVEDMVMICQIIAEWTFHKTVDLARSGISNEYWDAIMQKIAYTIFEIAKQGIEKKIEQKDLLESVEKNVNKVYKECIEELKKKNAITDDVANSAKGVSNIDKMAKEMEKKALKSPKYRIKQFIDYFKNHKILDRNFLLYLFVGVITFIAIAFMSLNFSFISAILAIGTFLISACAGYYFQQNRKIKEQMQQLEKVRAEMQDLVNPNKMYERLGVDVLSIQVGAGLLCVADPDIDGELLPRICALRQRLTDNYGFIIPNIRIMDSSKLEDNEYVISIRQNVVDSGFVYPDRYMVIADQWDKYYDEIPKNAIVGVDPTYKTQAYWIDEETAQNCNKEITCTDATDVIITHLEETFIKNVHDVMSIKDVLKLMELVRSDNPLIVDRLIPELILEVDFKTILCNLIKEKVSIKDIIFVFEKLCDYARFSQEPDILTERLRAAFGRQICLTNCDRDKVIYAVTLDKKWEELLDNSCQRSELGTIFLLTPKQVQEFVELVATTLMKAHQAIDRQPVILCSPRIRLPLYQLLVRHIPSVVVMSYSELITDVKVEAIGTICEES